MIYYSWLFHSPSLHFSAGEYARSRVVGDNSYTSELRGTVELCVEKLAE
jgi:hypothetical protein